MTMSSASQTLCAFVGARSSFPGGGKLWDGDQLTKSLLGPMPTLTQEPTIAERKSSGLGSVRATSLDEYAADLLGYRVFANE